MCTRKGTYLSSMPVAASPRQLFSWDYEYCLDTKNKLHFHSGMAAHALGVRLVCGGLPFILTQMCSDLYCCTNRRDYTGPIKGKRSLERVCLLSTALRFSLETHPCGRLKGADYLSNCALISAFLRSPKYQMDSFRLPSDMAEQVVLLLRRETSQL